ncbi:MAG: acyltransferase [Acetatifactor sp.]
MTEGTFGKKIRNSNLELLRILCILFIIGDHFTGQSGIYEGGNIGNHFFYSAVTSLSRVACSVFIIISAWFLVEKEFRFKRIIHVWLTVVMYTVPITVYLYVIGIASRGNIVAAFLPVEQSPLWFAGYYIVLVFIAPFLNLLICKAPKSVLEFFLFIFFCGQCLYTTITTDLGFFSNDIWTLIFLYLLTGYLKKYVIGRPKAGRAFILFGLVWLCHTVGRAIAANYGMALLADYCETYRARLQTIPNLLMAYSIFYAFLGLRINYSRIINTLASATLGVYCFHQVPVWYTYLWEHGFRSAVYNQTLHGLKRMLYTLCSILAVWIIGTMIELIRTKMASLLIEDRKYCVNFCRKIDACMNGDESKENKGKNKKILAAIAAVCSIYFLLLRIYALGF